MRTIFVAFALASCAADPVATQWRIITLPDGTLGAAIHCPGNLGVCYERAGRACSHGYDVLDKDSHTLVAGAGNRMRWETGSRYSGSLIIRCR